VATRRRTLTQSYALDLFERHPAALALRWWSTLESQWANFTLFDRAAVRLSVEDVAPLRFDSPPLREAAELLGLA
jgi:hypothetical protein